MSKTNSGRRQLRLTTPVTATEKARAARLAKAEGMSVAELVRTLLAARALKRKLQTDTLRRKKREKALKTRKASPAQSRGALSSRSSRSRRKPARTKPSKKRTTNGAARASSKKTLKGRIVSSHGKLGGSSGAGAGGRGSL